MTLYPGMVNSPETTTTSDITSGATTIPIADCSKLPAAPNEATLGTDESAETILYTGKSASSGAGNLTGVTRGFQGTAAAWSTGTVIARRFTEYDYASLIDQPLATSPNPSAYSWTYDSNTTMADPGAGNIRFNHSDLYSSNLLSINTTCNIGGVSATTVKHWLQGLSFNFGSGVVDYGSFTIRKVNDSRVWARFFVADLVWYSSTYAQIYIGAIANSGVFTNGDSVWVELDIEVPISHAMAQAAGDFLVGVGDSQFERQSLTSTKATLGILATDTDTTLASDSDTKLATQHATKTYVDGKTGVLPHPTVIATTTTSKGGVFNGDFELGSGSTSTTSTWIGSENYGWISSSNAASFSISYDSTVCHSGKQSLKLVGTSVAVGTSLGAFTSQQGYEVSHIIPIKPSTKYRLSGWVKVSGVTNVNGTGVLLAAYYGSTYPFNSTALATPSWVYGTADWAYYSVVFTPGASDTGISVVCMMSQETGTAWFDDIKLEEVVEDTGYTGTVPTPLLSTIVGITSTDSVDQSQTSVATAVFVGRFSGFNRIAAQSFTPTKSKLSGISVYKNASAGTPAGNFQMSIRTDNSNKPSTTVLASRELTLAQYDALTSGAFNYLDLPCILTPGTKYWMVFKDTVTESSNKYYYLGYNTSDTYSGGCMAVSDDAEANWYLSATEDLTFKTHYAKPTENATIICNGDKISLSADQDGILGGAIIDLDKGKYSYYSNIYGGYNSASFSNISDIYAASVGGSSTPCVINGWGRPTDQYYMFSASGATERYVTWKINTLFPIKHLKFQYLAQCFSPSATNVIVCEISTNNVNWTNIDTTVSVAAARVAESDIVNGLSTFYIRLRKDASINDYMLLTYIKMDIDIDISSIPTPQIYPLNTNQFSDDVILPSVATRVYFRLNKFANSNGVVVPHLEFTDASGGYIKAVPVRLDNSQETNPSIDIIVADTTNGQQSGTGSADSTTGYILNDGEYMTFSSTTSSPKITYQVGKGTTSFSNITKNVIYLSSNGSANDATKDPSHQETITTWYRIENIARVVSDLTNKVSNITKSLLPPGNSIGDTIRFDGTSYQRIPSAIATPIKEGTGAAGTATALSHEDHVHPTRVAIVRLDSNASGIASASATDITNMTIAVAATDTIEFEAHLSFSVNNNQGAKFAVSIPTGATLVATVFGDTSNKATFYFDNMTTGGTLCDTIHVTSSYNGMAVIRGTVKMDGSHSGNVKLQGASYNGTGTLTVLAGSSFKAHYLSSSTAW